MILPGAVAAGWESLAARSSAPSGDVTPGLLGFLVVAAMGLALFFLLRSMNKHLRRVRSVRDAGLEVGTRIDAKVGGAAKLRETGRTEPGGDKTSGGGPDKADSSSRRPSSDR